ncbi:unnamed protein product [Lampetra fluviatilis]
MRSDIDTPEPDEVTCNGFSREHPSVPQSGRQRDGSGCGVAVIEPLAEDLQSVPHGAFDRLGKLQTIILRNNPWNCSRCEVLYLSEWIAVNGDKVKITANSDIAEPDRATFARAGSQRTRLLMAFAMGGWAAM